MPLASADVLKQHAEAAADHRDSPAFAELSALMCWSAVIRCARNAGAISSFRAERLERLDWKEDFADFVSPSDTLVRHADDMRQVPVGAFIAFIRVDPPDAWHRFLHVRKGKRHIVHAMLSLGKGWAAGNKNSSVGIGHDVGWEKLNLAEHLNWVGGERYDAINGYPRNVRARLPLRIRYRKLEAFQIEDQGRRDGSTKVQTLATDKTAVVKPGERWQVGPLADCVAVAAIKRTDNLRAGQRAGRVFIWHVNG
ncbi:MAG: hypothetical protein FJ189_08975, partial [Gammaproteobacteria bacterium]|nr:hypothetical protein [Gammaproteobacteria bacterium]